MIKYINDIKYYIFNINILKKQYNGWDNELNRLWKSSLIRRWPSGDIVWLTWRIPIL